MNGAGKFMFSSDDGFILLEIMVSLSIMAIVFISLFRMQSATIDLAAAGKFNSVAPLLAQLKLSEVEADLPDFESGSGDFGDDLIGYFWECTVTGGDSAAFPILQSDNSGSLKKIDIRIRDSQRQKSFQMTAWRYVDE